MFNRRIVYRALIKKAAIGKIYDRAFLSSVNFMTLCYFVYKSLIRRRAAWLQQMVDWSVPTISTKPSKPTLCPCIPLKHG